jgi:pyridinium-3,5-bisthiocarboxylic acid mononucleotide nickel chelatase
MPNAIYFDCFSGISGDMALGALLDVGLPLDALRAELDKLKLDGWSIDAERGMRRYLSGTRALVHAPEQATHRHLSDVQSIIGSSALAPELKQRALHVFTLLAEAEGQVHGIPAGQVHFHEVGALDAIVDIVGVMAGLHLLDIKEVYASALPLGTGWTRAAHGALPLPAPAVLALLASAHAPTVPDDTPFELVTPTGAALLAGLAEFRRPPLHIERVGYGLGARDLERPNVLRVWLGTVENGAEIAHRLVLLETNIDDQPAEQLAYVVERLLALGALDAWLAPIQMKKGRAATLLSALVPAELEAAAVTLLMHETTTLGLRRRVVERYVAEREIVAVETPLGPVRVKRKRWQGQDLGAAPEYEDCARLAREHGLALREVYRMALEELRIQR